MPKRFWRQVDFDDSDDLERRAAEQMRHAKKLDASQAEAPFPNKPGHPLHAAHHVRETERHASECYFPGCHNEKIGQCANCSHKIDKKHSRVRYFEGGRWRLCLDCAGDLDMRKEAHR